MELLNLMVTVFASLVLNQTHGAEGLRAVNAVEFEGALTVRTTETILVITFLEVVN
jgi:hypothetical protein